MTIEYSAFESGPVETGMQEIDTELESEILGDSCQATEIEESPYDPQNEMLRAL